MDAIMESNPARRWAKIMHEPPVCPWCSNGTNIVNYSMEDYHVDCECPKCEAEFTIFVRPGHL